MEQSVGSCCGERNFEIALGVVKQRFGDRFQAGLSIREQHGHTTTWIENQIPDAVVFATDKHDVTDVIKICADYRVPVIPYGTGTSLEGHVNAPFGGISVDVSQMNSILDVYAEDMQVVVQPGVTRDDLNIHLRNQGLFFPIDPGANASLGGMTATRASGTNAVRYGTMKDNVIALEAVMANGSIIRTARRAKKSSAGYDLTRLMVGSEGTLGLITEVTLKLYGIPESISAVVCSFPSVDAACQVTMQAIQYGLPIARIELLDIATVRAINAYSKLNLPEDVLLLLEFHGTKSGVDEQVDLFQHLAEEMGGHGYESATTTEDRTRLWKGRHDAYWAILAMYPGKQAMVTDVCVPISRLAECVTAAQEKLTELNLSGTIAGHVGDGNFHTALLVDLSDSDECSRARHYVGWLNDLAISMDGTCTGEHGVGQGKTSYLKSELGLATDFMLAVKKAFDPHNILNPGKILQQ